METKKQVADADGTIQKAESIPSVKEIICPLIYRLTGGAVRYDLSFSPTITLGDNPPGAWRSAPQITLNEDAKAALESKEKTWKDITVDDIQVDGKGQKKARSYALQFWQTLEALRESGKLTWEEHAFYFTHEQGMKAREEYEQSVLTGQHKANKRSWVGTPDDPDKPGFSHFTGVSWEQLEAGEVPEAARTMKTLEWFVDDESGLGDLTLGEYMRSLYKKSTVAYISKSAKRDKIAKVVQGMGLEMTDIPTHLDEIATQCGMSADEVSDLILGIDTDATKEEITVLEEHEPTPEELADVEVPSEEELVAGIDTLEKSVGDATRILVYDDASKERIQVSSESVVVRGSDHEDHVHHFIELPDGTEMFLEEGFFYELKKCSIGEDLNEVDPQTVCVLINTESSTQQEAD